VAAPAAKATRARQRFYLSLDDPLMRIFAGDRVKSIMERLKMPTVKRLKPASSRAALSQRSVRLRLAIFDEAVAGTRRRNDQRKVIYQQRNDIMDADSLAGQIASAAGRLFH
jgi:preprotein translocase subunit SecA